MFSKCKKYEWSGLWWCKKPEGHTGCCENGYWPYKLRGFAEDCMKDIADYTKAIDEIAKKDYRLKTTEWRRAMRHVRSLGEAIQKRLDYLEELKKEEVRG